MVILRDVTFHICSNDLYDNCDNSDVRDDWCGKDNWPAACLTFPLYYIYIVIFVAVVVLLSLLLSLSLLLLLLLLL